MTPPQPVQAQQAYQEAVDVDPYDVNALSALARLAAANGDVKTARAAYRRATDLDRWNPVTIQSNADFELANGEAAAAAQLLSAALSRLPSEAALWALLGNARVALGDDVDARAAYDRALALDPTQATAVAGVAKLAA